MSRDRDEYNGARIEREFGANRTPVTVEFWTNRNDVTRYTLKPVRDVDHLAVKQAEIDLAAIFSNVGAVVRGIGEACRIVFWVRP